MLTCVHTYLGSQINTVFSHIVFLGRDTCVSACSHCRPLGCAVLHTVLPACPPSETRHLWTSILLEWYNSPSLEPPPMPGMFHWAHTDAFLIYDLLFVSKVVIIRTLFLVSSFGGFNEPCCVYFLGSIKRWKLEFLRHDDSVFLITQSCQRETDSTV